MDSRNVKFCNKIIEESILPVVKPPISLVYQLLNIKVNTFILGKII